MNKDRNVPNPSDEEILNVIKKSIGTQISEILDETNISENKAEDTQKPKDTTLPPYKEELLPKKKKQLPKWFKIVSIVFSLFFVLGLTAVVGAKMFLGRINYDGGKNSDVTKENPYDGTDSKWDTLVDNANKVDGVFNILLLGIEAINTSEEHGRTDSIMIATINTNLKTLKLTSIMRDTYVQIPGYKDNRINAAYGLGGVELLKETITQNFNLHIDGYVSVNFESFEKLIDELGGVEVSLTETEADYLNHTNYISDKTQRNVSSGKQKLNGNQARGYCRIRKVATENNGADDFGRTFRQRAVLTAIFDTYKSTSLPKLLSILWDILPYITTDINQSDIINYAFTVLSNGTDTLETFRIPVSNGYKGTYMRNMSVLVPDLQKNIEELHSFIYESDSK
jgi:LCP family protein required for cell wall assembly